MSPVVIALFFAIGIAGWTYSKINHRSGGNTQADLTVTAIVGVIAFLICWSVFSMIT